MNNGVLCPTIVIVIPVYESKDPNLAKSVRDANADIVVIFRATSPYRCTILMTSDNSFLEEVARRSGWKEDEGSLKTWQQEIPAILKVFEVNDSYERGVQPYLESIERNTCVLWDTSREKS